MTTREIRRLLTLLERWQRDHGWDAESAAVMEAVSAVERERES